MGGFRGGGGGGERRKRVFMVVVRVREWKWGRGVIEVDWVLGGGLQQGGGLQHVVVEQWGLNSLYQ